MLDNRNVVLRKNTENTGLNIGFLREIKRKTLILKNQKEELKLTGTHESLESLTLRRQIEIKTEENRV